MQIGASLGRERWWMSWQLEACPVYVALGFDLLLGIDAMKALGGIAVGPSGLIQIGDRLVAKCAAITINEPDFTVTFDHLSWA